MKKSAFTLIELLVVLVIIAIVAQAVLARPLCALECRVLLSCVRLNARGDLQVRDENVGEDVFLRRCHFDAPVTD